MGDVYAKLKVAAVQAAPVFLDREATVEKACQLILEAGRQGAEIIGFPECYIPGFPHWFTFHYPQDCRGFFKELFKNAVEVPSEATERLGQAARAAKAYVVMGINEKEPRTLGTLYNTQLFIDRDGSLLGKHRKIVPTLFERLVHKGGDGSTLQVFPTAFGELGGLICGENTNSLARFALLAQGEKIHVAAWPAFATKDCDIYKRGIEIRTRYHAFEGKVFVISSTGIFSQEMVERLCDTEEKRRMVVDSGGFSAILAPNGDYLAGPLTSGEGILYADIDLEQIIEGKFSHDLIGHYNRFDLFTLLLDTSTHPSLVINRREGGATKRLAGEERRLDPIEGALEPSQDFPVLKSC